MPIFPAGDYRDYNRTPFELFKLFFDDDLLQLISRESNSYGVAKEHDHPNITPKALLRFIGIMITTGYVPRPSTQLNWSNKGDVFNKMVSECMSANRFKQIGRCIHFASDDLENRQDKMWKLRPLTDHLNRNFQRHFVPEQHLSYDESMIAYYGRHGCKQFIKGKPLRFGYKVWCLNTPLGYNVAFDIYQGANHRYNTEVETKFGKCVTPLLYMIDGLPAEKKALPFCFYFDNLFTGLPVLHFLKNHGYDGTGTIRQNRLPKSCPLPDKKSLSKKARGFSVTKSIRGTSIKVTKWVDNNVVSMASTIYAEEPKDTAGRYSRADHARVQVNRPAVVSAYNRHMGGVDRMDQNIASYRIAVRKKKWWFSIFTWTVDVAIQNAWLSARKNDTELKQLDFRRALAEYLCVTVSDEDRAEETVRRLASTVPNAEIRFDGMNHFVRPSVNRRHCKLATCKSQTRLECSKCNVGLCAKCFVSYHTTRLRE